MFICVLKCSFLHNFDYYTLDIWTVINLNKWKSLKRFKVIKLIRNALENNILRKINVFKLEIETFPTGTEIPPYH